METVQTLIEQAERAEEQAARDKQARIEAQVEEALRAIRECPLWTELEAHAEREPRYMLEDRYYRHVDDQVRVAWYRVNVPGLAPFDVEAVVHGEGWNVCLSAQGCSKRVPAKDAGAVAALFLECRREWQKGQESAREKQIDDLLAAFAYQRRARSPSEADDALVALIDLAPGNEEEWREGHRQWLEWRQEYSETQRQKEIYADALARYREALVEWKERRDAAIERNRAALVPLQEELNEPFVVHKLTYASVAHDGGEAYVDTHAIYTLGQVDDSGWWLVLRGYDNVHVEKVRYFHLVEIGAGIETRPADGDYAARVRIHDAGTEIYFHPGLDSAEIVAKASALLEPLPEAPDAPEGIDEREARRTRRQVTGSGEEYYDYY